MSGFTWRYATFLPVLTLAVVAISHGEAQPFQSDATAQSSTASADRQALDHEGQPLPVDAIARIGSGRLRAGGEIIQLLYAPDGATIIAVVVQSHWPSTGSIELWNAASGTLRRAIPAEVDYSCDLRCSRDGKTLHYYCDGLYRVLDTKSGKELSKLKVPHAPHARGRLSPNGKLLAIQQADGYYSLFELAKGTEVRRFTSEDSGEGGRIQLVSSGAPLAFAPDGRTLAIVSPHGVVEGFDTASGDRCFSVKAQLTRWDDMLYSANGRDLFCSGHSQDWVVIRDAPGKAEIVRLPHDGPDTSMPNAAFSPDGNKVAVGGGHDYVTLYNVATAKAVRRVPAGWCSSIPVFSPDGRLLLAGNRVGAISKWDVETGKLLPSSASPLSEIRVERFLDGTKHLLVRTDRHEVIDWRSGKVAERYTVPAAYADFGSLLSPDRKFLLVCKVKQHVLLDAKTGKEVLRLGSEKSPMYFDQFTPSGKRFLTYTEDGKLNVWDRGATKPVYQLGPIWPTQLRAVSGDDRWLAMAHAGNAGDEDYDHDVRIVDLTSGKLVQRLSPRNGGAYALTFSRDGNYLAMATAAHPMRPPFEVTLVETRTGRELRVVAVYQRGIACFCFSPDARTLVVTDQTEGTVRLWETATGAERHRFDGHRTPAYSLAFSADGSVLAAGSHDAPAYVWDIYGKHSPHTRAAEIWPVEMPERLLKDLAGPDARAAFQTVRRLVGNPGQAVALLRNRLRPTQPVELKRLKQRFDDLASDDYDTRQSAQAELEKLGDRIEPHLQQAVAGRVTLEAKRRLQKLLEMLETPTPERLARWRALEVLEQVGTPEALQLLKALAAGAPEARLTREAAAVVDRLGKQ